MAEEKLLYSHIPEMITDNWADGNGNVRVVLSGESGVKEIRAEAVFSEFLIDDFSKDEAEAPDPMDEMIERLIDGDNDGDSLRMRYAASDLIMSFYHCAPAGRGRLQDFSLTHRDEILKKHENGSLESFISEFLRTERKFSDVTAASIKGTVNCLLLLDLAVTFVEAPSSCSFVLSDNPFCMGNFLSPDPRTTPEMKYTLYGTFFILPLTPKRALCLYDDYVYKLRKTDGRIVLTPDDVERLNTYLMANGTKYVVPEDFPYADDIPEKYRAGEGEAEISSLSVFQIRARGVEVEGEVREYPVDFILENGGRLDNLLDDDFSVSGDVLLSLISSAAELLSAD